MLASFKMKLLDKGNQEDAAHLPPREGICYA